MNVADIAVCKARMVSFVTRRYFSCNSYIAFCPSPSVPRSSYACMATRRAAALSGSKYRIAYEYRSWLARSYAIWRCSRAPPGVCSKPCVSTGAVSSAWSVSSVGRAWPSFTANISGCCMLRMKPVFLSQSAKSSGLSPVYDFFPRTALIRLLLVAVLLETCSYIFQAVG